MSLKKQVQKIDVDLYEYHPNFGYDYTDIHVTTEFVDNRHYNIIITRLDQPKGWNDTLKILIHYRGTEITTIISVDPSEEIYQKIVGMETEFDIHVSPKDVDIPNTYSLPHKDSIPVDKMSREEFEKTFETEIYSQLPDDLYAVGFMNGKIYMYNEKFGSYYEIIYSIKIIALIFFAYYSPEKKYHFLICANDGYFEENYLSLHRTFPKVITEYENGKRILLDNLEEYPVFYKNKWILGMSNHLNMPFTIDIIDRHYLYCNLYNPFRSFHRGIPFHEKKNQIIFGCRVLRCSKYNFYTSKPDLGDISPRQYFYTDNVCKDNVVYGYEQWIDSKDMVNYKYILDVDGNACTWDATAWKLNSGSVIIKTKSPWKQWFYDDYLPWVHFVPIADDFSDLQEKYHWCEEHPLECERMIIRCKDLFQQTFRFSNIIEYVQSIFERTSENLSF